MTDTFAILNDAVRAGLIDRARAMLDAHPDLGARLDDPTPDSFDSPMLFAAVQAKDLALVDLLVERGAHINARTRWWAGGFGILEVCDPAIAPALIARGAVVDAHSAARLGMFDRLVEVIGQDAGAVNARAGDGKSPLHYASTVDIAKLLLSRGAAIDALDVDHESTPAQYLVREHPDVARFLVTRGCRTDILLAASLGAIALVRRMLDAEPGLVQTRVSRTWFPMRNRHAGGTIYQWTLGGGKTAHIVAKDAGHDDVYALLMERSPDTLKLAVACRVKDSAEAARLLGNEPDLASRLSDEERAQLGEAASAGDVEAVRAMLDAGWPVDVMHDGATPLHWAAWHGEAELVRLLLAHHAPVDVREAGHQGTPLDWARHGASNSWRRQAGDYPAVISALESA